MSRRPDTTSIEIFGGEPTDKLVIHAPDPAWPHLFAQHESRIRAALGDAASDIHHVGSTSVPDLAAKAIIDILLVVEDITDEEQYVEPLVAAGYVLRVREPGHRLLRTPQRDVHIHVHEPDHPESVEFLLFRDHLRRDAADRALYEATKRSLLSQEWTHMQAYADAKQPVIAAIKARARASDAVPTPTLRAQR